LASARTFTLTILLIAVVSAAIVAYVAFPVNPSRGTTTTLQGGTAEYIYPTANTDSDISAKLGETFAIQLSSNAGSTGYDWRVLCSGGIQYLNYTVVSTSSLVGGPQVRNYFFFAAKTGSQTIVLQNRRSFAPFDVAATISLQVAVS